MTMPGERVSVVIPTYNRAALVGRAISDVQKQTVPVAAVIVVDDGSTDATRDVVNGLIREDPRIILVSQANAGANVARNAGVARARTELVAFLDSDDRWLPAKIAHQLAALRQWPDSVASFTGIQAVDGDRPLYRYDIPADPSLDELRRHNALGTTSTALVRTEVLRAVGGFDASLPSCQDWDLWLRLRRSGPFAIAPEILVLYDEGPHDRISGDLGKALAGHRAVFARALADVDNRRERARIHAVHADVLTRIYRRSGRRGSAVGQALRALLFDPSYRRGRRLAAALLR